MSLRIHKTDPNTFAWRLVGPEGRILALSTHTYHDSDSAAEDADRFRRHGTDGTGTTGAFRVEGRDGAFRWSYSDGSGRLARSPDPLESEEAAVAAYTHVQTVLKGESRPRQTSQGFDPEILNHSLITVPLLERFEQGRANELHRVIVELNHNYRRELSGAHKDVKSWIKDIIKSRTGRDDNASATAPAPSHRRARLLKAQSKLSYRYVVADLTRAMVRELVTQDGENASRAPSEVVENAVPPGRAIYRVWPDFKVRPLLHHSARTVKADAAQKAFGAAGKGVVWAVVDSGVDGAHPHLKSATTLPAGLAHKDFVDTERKGAPIDPCGHGSHVAGIIAGSVADDTVDDDERPLHQLQQEADPDGEPRYRARPVGAISGVAPDCTVLSVRVLDADGNGHASDVIAALQYVGSLNKGGRDLRVHGVNLSVGYDFDPEWYACGHSPLCQEVDLLVRSGVVVVAAAGNTGHGTAYADARQSKTGIDLTINDPGNAEKAITVGSTHRAEPHRYGVSYFSSKGPTGDGRAKPDLVAPGERVLSCAAGSKRDAAERKIARMASREEGPSAWPTTCHYVADSGTSMAAPHVSGAIAAFLSVRREFIGRSEDVKALFLRTATDLGRDPYFQGAGLADLMRALQAV